ncbi:MAG: MaoC family dehydratase [Hyphomicrobiaceae bacterium]|nr:MaoC family dehydratase [Hyphomicrobiaceae bacterium]
MTDTATPPSLSPLYFDDFHVGQRFVSGTHQITADEIKAYAALYDPQAFHLDEEAARDTFFGGLAASGWHTAALTMKLVVDVLPVAGGVVGAGGDLQWPRPTRPGDTLHVEVDIVELTPSRSRPDRGSAIMRNTTRNQNGEAVQIFTVRVPLPRRVAG